MVKSLMTDMYLVEEALSTTYWALTKEGEDVCVSGSPEIIVFKSVPPEGISLPALNR